MSTPASSSSSTSACTSGLSTSVPWRAAATRMVTSIQTHLPPAMACLRATDFCTTNGVNEASLKLSLLTLLRPQLSSNGKLHSEYEFKSNLGRRFADVVIEETDFDAILELKMVKLCGMIGFTPRSRAQYTTEASKVASLDEQELLRRSISSGEKDTRTGQFTTVSVDAYVSKALDQAKLYAGLWSATHTFGISQKPLFVLAVCAFGSRLIVRGQEM